MSNPNPLQIYLSFLGSAFMLTPDPYRLLLPVDTALRECGERVESLRDEADVEWAEQVAEDESEVAERLVGIAFMVCQVHIAHVVSQVKRLHSFAGKFGVELRTTNGTRPGIVRSSSKELEGSSVTEVQLIDEAANYAKHRDEWVRTEWSDLEKLEKKTADVLLAVGAKQGYTGNCSLILEKLSGAADLKPSRLVPILETWCADLGSQYGAELRRYADGLPQSAPV